MPQPPTAPTPPCALSPCTAFGVSIALIIALSCSEDLRRRHPYNLLALAAFTVCEAVLVGTVSAAYDTNVVLLAIGMTAAVVLGCALFATQSKYDLTMASGAMISLSLAFMSAFLINLFVRTTWLYVGICIGGVLLFSLYLMFDLQLLMGGHKYELSADEYVFAALNLYLDIINSESTCLISIRLLCLWPCRVGLYVKQGLCPRRFFPAPQQGAPLRPWGVRMCGMCGIVVLG